MPGFCLSCILFDKRKVGMKKHEVAWQGVELALVSITLLQPTNPVKIL